jgi:hypothetical protein
LKSRRPSPSVSRNRKTMSASSSVASRSRLTRTPRSDSGSAMNFWPSYAPSEACLSKTSNAWASLEVDSADVDFSVDKSSSSLIVLANNDERDAVAVDVASLVRFGPRFSTIVLALVGFDFVGEIKQSLYVIFSFLCQLRLRGFSDVLCFVFGQSTILFYRIVPNWW